MARVLIATDGSDPAIAAARRAVGLLGPGHEFTVVTVVDAHPDMAVGASGLLGIDPLAIPVSVGDPDAAADIERAVTSAGEERLERTAAALGVTSVTRVVEGQAGPEICRLAEDDGFDLVVVSTHGTGLVHRLLHGSVSHHVVHHCARPVLVVPE